MIEREICSNLVTDARTPCCNTDSTELVTLSPDLTGVRGESADLTGPFCPDSGVERLSIAIVRCG